MSHTDDIIERYRKNRTQHIIKSGESYREADVYCPYCGIEQVNDEGQFGRNDDYDKWVEHECADCGRTFECTWEASYTTRIIERIGCEK